MKRFLVGFVLGALIFGSMTAFANDEVRAKLTDIKLMVNGQLVELENKVMAVEGRSYLPVREVANLVGYDVDYNDATRTIILNKKQEEDVQNTDQSNNPPKNHEQNNNVIEGLGDMFRNDDDNLDLEAIKQAVENGEVKVDSVDENGNTLLLLASDKIENYRVGEFLINKGANLNHQNNEGKTAVHIAVIENNQAFLRLLIESGASTIIEDNDGKRPIDYTKEYSTIWGTLKAYVQ